MPVKVTAFILAVLVLVLSCIPCADISAELQLASSLSKVAGEEPGHSHEEHQDCIDLCSPLCHCACCAGFSIIYRLNSIPQQQAVAERPVYTEKYITAALIDISLPIWQPPQLV